VIREGVEIQRGDATEPATLAGALKGCQAVVHLVGIIREFPAKGVTFQRLHVEATQNLVDAAQAGGVERFLHMSANGTRAEAQAEYHQTKWQAEEAVRASGLAWTIFRPSLIFGRDDEFVNMLAGLVRKLPVVPVIGDGQYRMSPVAVEDVAASFVRALTRPQTAGELFHCCGPQTFTYDEVLDLVGTALGRKKVRKVHYPALFVKPVIALLDGFPWFPITRTQLTMLLEGNLCDPRPWAEALGLTPQPFAEGIRRYLQR
ncbi:MAG: NAD(P)H-binding protein, partial [Desulfuromonadales bacterium]|nr:NAD(P)H-binding protein [Desulfuromonadales bacterium]